MCHLLATSKTGGTRRQLKRLEAGVGPRSGCDGRSSQEPSPMKITHDETRGKKSFYAAAAGSIDCSFCLVVGVFRVCLPHAKRGTCWCFAARNDLLGDGLLVGTCRRRVGKGTCGVARESVLLRCLIDHG